MWNICFQYLSCLVKYLADIVKCKKCYYNSSISGIKKIWAYWSEWMSSIKSYFPLVQSCTRTACFQKQTTTLVSLLKIPKPVHPVQAILCDYFFITASPYFPLLIKLQLSGYPLQSLRKSFTAQNLEVTFQIDLLVNRGWFS